jgi:hypothetical protein
MLRGIGARCLMATAVMLLGVVQARAGGPAIQEPNGLFGIKLGYAQVGRSGGGQVLNGVFNGGQFIECLNNDCGSTSFGRTIIMGGKGQVSGFSAYGGTQAALPLGHDFGLQFDGELGGLQGAGGGDATLHLFRGDPAVGLVGPLINYLALGDAGYLRAALEGQFYWKDATFYGNAGYQWANNGNDINVGSGIAGCGYVAYYPVESLMLLAGGGGGPGEAAGYGQVEWQAFRHGAPGVSFFAEGMVGTDDSAAAFAGLRYHFGAGNSLEMRHRHELPLRDTLCGMEQFTAPGSTTLNIFPIE